MSLERDIEFLYELGSLRNVQRGWRQHLGVDCANDLEHTLRVTWMALALARREKELRPETQIDETLLLKMALAHDVCETRTSDHSYIQKVYVRAEEERAVNDLFRDTSLVDFTDVAAKYEARDCLESKLVKDADNLDVDMELRELEERGHKLPEKWMVFRKKIVDEKLYTQAAKDFWHGLQTADPAAWHMNANKWVKIPEAGK